MKLFGASNAAAASVLDCVLDALKIRVTHSQDPASQMVQSGKLDTFLAYREVPGDAASRFTKARQKIHSQIIADYQNDISKLAQHLDQTDTRKKVGKPILVLMRGNSGAGKSRALKQIDFVTPDLEKGAINPDTIKTRIQNEFENGIVSSQAVHEEGSMLANQLITDALNKGQSIIIDKRFASLDKIEALNKSGALKKYHVIMVDVDAPLETSAQRIAQREIGGSSPNVPMGAIVEGFTDIQIHRQSVSQSPLIQDYTLFRDGKVVASRSGTGELKIADTEKWRMATLGLSAEEKASLDALYGDLLNYLSQTMPGELLRPVRKDLVDDLPFFNLPRDSKYTTDAYPKVDPNYVKGAIEHNIGYNLYQVAKSGGIRDHENLAVTVRDYLEHSIRDGKITIKVLHEGSDNSLPSVEVRIKSNDKNAKGRLLSDSRWPFRIDPKTDPLNPDVVLDTHDLTRRLPEDIVEYRDYENGIGIGVNPRNLSNAGSRGHEFIKNGNDLGKIKNSPPLVQFEIKKNASFEFSRHIDTVHFRKGFRSDETQAYAFGSQIELLAAMDALGKGDRIGARDYLARAEMNYYIAADFMGMMDTALKGKFPDILVVRAEGGQWIDLVTWLAAHAKKLEEIKSRIEKVKKAISSH